MPFQGPKTSSNISRFQIAAERSISAMSGLRPISVAPTPLYWPPKADLRVASPARHMSAHEEATK